MRFVTTAAAETIDDLVARAYGLPDTAPQALRERARTALVEINPFLQSPGTVPDGTIAAVPDVDGAEPGADTRDADQTALSAGVDQFDGLGPLILDAVLLDAASVRAQATSALELLRSAEVKKLARGNDQLRAALAAIVQTASARLDGARQLEEYATTALERVQKDLAAMRSAFG